MHNRSVVGIKSLGGKMNEEDLKGKQEVEKEEGAVETGGEKFHAPSPIKQTQLVTFGDRVTYTFAYGKEVGSIHYDHARSEIFFKGHNVRYMELENWQMQMLEKTRLILQGEARTKRLAEAYGKTLDKIIYEKSKVPRSSP
ncbi:MAG: hypothetical protein HYT77_04925 [Deltaproteobacteria bacterium]|nr:hypothetical protein [Deltaproteobacteria bacterium]